jgi:hypothetical protein
MPLSNKSYRSCLIVLSFLTLVFTRMSYAQESAQQSRLADSMRLRYLNDQYIQSWIKSDTATYNRLLWADAFVHLGAGKGKLITKNELATVFGAKRFDQIAFFYADSVTIRFMGDSVAFIYAVTPYCEIGSSVIEYSRYNDVYIKNAAGWKCIAANTVNIDPHYFTLTGIQSLPPAHESIFKINDIRHTDQTAILLLNRKWVHAFVKSDEKFYKENGSSENWITYPDGSLKKGILKGFQLPVGKDSILHETISFPRKDFAIVRNIVAFTADQSQISALQMCNYYYHHKGKWEMVSFNATAIRD